MVSKIKSLLRRYIPESVRTFLLVRRVILNGSLLEYALVFAAFLIFTILLTNLVAFSAGSQLFVSGPGDGTAGFLWLNYVDRSLSVILSSTDFVNYPYGEQLGSASFITYSTLWLPMRVLSFIFGPVISLNLVTFAGFILSGMSMYWLVKKLTNSVWIALFAGYAVAFTPYALVKSSAHLAYIFSVVFVLIIGAFIGVWKRPTILRAVIFAAAIAGAFYTDGYYVLLASVLVFCLCAGGVVHGILSRFSLKDFWKRIKYLLVSVAALAVFLTPIAIVQLTQGDQIRGNLASARSDIVNEMNAYRAWPIDFVLPPATNPILEDNEDFIELNQVRNSRSNHSENSNYMGVFILLLIGVGGALLAVALWRWIRGKTAASSHEAKNFLLIGSIGAVTLSVMLAFMLSPYVTILGMTFYLPGQLFLDYDISYWRVMSRFYVPLHVMAVLFAAITLALVLKKANFTKSSGALKKTGIAVVLVVWLITGLEYATTINRPSFDFNRLPAAYTWLRDQADIDVIAELPLVDPLDPRTADYVTAQIFHGKKLINMKEPAEGRTNNTTGSYDNPETANYILSRGAQAVVLHEKSCDISLDWASLVHESQSYLPEKRMCIFKVNSDTQFDNAFAVYESGVVVGARYPKTDEITLNGQPLTVSLTDSSFVKAYDGGVDLTVNVSCGTAPSWAVVQASQTVAVGQGNQITARLNGAEPATITIDRDAQDATGACALVRSEAVDNRAIR